MSVQALDLSSNRIANLSEVEGVVGMASLQQLSLVGNPVAARPAAFTKAFTNVSTTLHCHSRALAQHRSWCY